MSVATATPTITVPPITHDEKRPASSSPMLPVYPYGIAPDYDPLYPDSDGKPMADNTLQGEWITILYSNISALAANDPNIFVAADLLWYPERVQTGRPPSTAPDVMVAFGRPKGYRGSYKQWEEDGIPPQVVFEILSPGNSPAEMIRKADFYQRYGAEECYYYDPYTNELTYWIRDEKGDTGTLYVLEDEWTSPRLGIRFVRDEKTKKLHICHPDGTRFRDFTELMRDLSNAESQRLLAESQQQAAEAQRAAAEAQREAAETALQAERERTNRLLALLQERGISPEELTH